MIDELRWRLADLQQLLTDRDGAQLSMVLEASSFLVNGLICRDHQALLPSEATIDVLPPFAGG